MIEWNLDPLNKSGLDKIAQWPVAQNRRSRISNHIAKDCRVTRETQSTITSSQKNVSSFIRDQKCTILFKDRIDNLNNSDNKEEER